MSKQEKLRAKLKNNPNDAKFSDIRKLLEQVGFALDRITGSHHIFVKDEITFVIPVHNKKVKTIYAKRVIELLEQTENQGGDEQV